MPATNNYERPLFRGRAPFSIYDLPIALAVFGLIWAVLTVGRDMTSPVLPESGEFDLSYLKLPYYALRSVFRMFVAYLASLVFTFIFGSLAAHNKTAEKIIIPTVDILQSVPILGFLAVTVNGFMALFPGSIMGIELASIFAIFTSMVWNLVYSFFQSVKTIPQELLESTKVYRLSSMQRFVRLEVPSAMIGLVWNSMVSFGGGWFFLAASEAITVLKKDIRLPGLGSYLATAVEQGDIARIFAAIILMLTIVITLDLIFFRPLLAWAQKFSSSESLDSDCESNVLTALQRSTLIERFQEHVSKPMWSLLIDQIPARIGRIRHSPTFVVRRRRISWIGILLLVVGAAALIYKVGDGIFYLFQSMTAREFGTICLAGLATMGRVLATVLLASLVWVPVGTYIGTRPALARRIRPIIQIGAAFPANLVYPLLVALFVAAGVGLGVGSIVLMFVATQWYILFNVIVGALTVPEDLSNAADVMGLKGFARFRYLVAPVVFPYWVTGALTAAGGAWNASIVTEVASYASTEMKTFGLGSYIAQATVEGHWTGIVVSIVVMCLFVVLMNRFLWRRLYRYGEEHLSLDR